MYDVIIVGAGPTGLIAARELHKAGVTYLVVDGKKQLGLPVRCGEGLRESEFVEFFDHTNYPFVRNIATTHIGQINDISREFSVNIIELDRDKWEQWLGKDLHIQLETKVLDIKITKAAAEIITCNGTLQSKVVILAYGAQYRFQKQFNLIDKMPNFFPTYAGIYKDYDMDPTKFYFFFDDVEPGYLWVFPKDKDTANIGYGAVNGKNIKERFAAMCIRHNVSGELITPISGIIPADGPIKKTYHDRLLVAGDAAGMVYAGTGEGIFYGMKAGRHAARTCIQALAVQNFSSQFLARYEKAWKKDIGEILHAGKMFLDISMFGLRLRMFEKMFAAAPKASVERLIIQGKPSLDLKALWYAQKYLTHLSIPTQKLFLTPLLKTAKYILKIQQITGIKSTNKQLL